MAGIWTPERRARAAEITRQVKPWLSSTGPRSPEGKAASSRNHYQGGKREKARAAAREVKAKLKALDVLCLELEQEGICFHLTLPPLTDDQLRRIIAGETALPPAAPGGEVSGQPSPVSGPPTAWVFPPVL